MKEYFNKEIAMTSEDDKGDKNFTKCWFVINFMLIVM